MSEETDLAGAYTSYEGFLKAAIKSYWEKGGDRANFIALLLASREAWQVALDGVRAPGTGKKVLTGAAGAAALVVVLRMFLGGPIGLVLTGASIASLGALYARNHRRIWAQRSRYEELIGQFRVKHQQLRSKFVEGAVDEDERNLMIDGLLRRFLDEIDIAPDLGEEEDDAEDASEDE